MASFERPPRQRHKATVLCITGIVAVCLIVLMIARYSIHASPLPTNASGSRVSTFYTTILSATQSYFGTKK
ncbi:MAG TPA: hypothetical protein VG621_03560 [Candidatus Paceibacterota bacterium]|nr:hypothetical protein [Candidatus Paceibacterota bacterium]